jgi:hypothetical protein
LTRKPASTTWWDLCHGLPCWSPPGIGPLHLRETS